MKILNEKNSIIEINNSINGFNKRLHTHKKKTNIVEQRAAYRKYPD